MTLYKDLCLVVIGDTRLGKNQPWDLTSDPIIFMVVADYVIPDSMGENCIGGHGEGSSASIVGVEGFIECNMLISNHHSSIMVLMGWVWIFVRMPLPPS